MSPQSALSPGYGLALALFAASCAAVAEEGTHPPALAPAATALETAEKEAPALTRTASSAMSILKLIDEGFAELYERVAPAVVVIEATKKAEDGDGEESKSLEFFPSEKDPHRDVPKGPQPWKLPQQPARSEGSGFFIRPDGIVLTNLHVVAESDKLTVRTKDGRSFAARVLGTDDKTDIAVLKVDAKDMPVVEFGDSEALRVGQLVSAIGTPYNQDFSFTFGCVSGKGRSNLLGPTSSTILYEDYIQTDAFINPGNSGGPLFDVEGKVVGMNTLINGIGRGLAFAIPSNLLQQVSTELIYSGKVIRAWLGIRIESLAENPVLREHAMGLERGVVVDTIEANAPAYKSELRPADIITEVDGQKVSTAHELQKEVLKKRVGQSVLLTIWRSGQFLKIPVQTGELPNDQGRVSSVEPRKAPLLDAKDEGFGMKLKDAKPGAQVVEVAPDTAASLADLQPDDIIADVEGKPVSDGAACFAAIRAAGEKANRHGVLLNIDRKGKRTYAVLNPAK